MRWWLFILVVACAAPPPPPKPPDFAAREPADTYHTRIANLRTTLGRAGIALRVAGHDAAFETADCRPDAEQAFGGCARCELAGEQTAIDGAVIEAATRAFARYPTEVLVASKIAHVSVCREIVYAKDEGLEHAAGLADLRGHGLLLSVSYFLGQSEYRSDAAFTVDDIAHHEVFHFLEYELMSSDMLKDSEWNLHNPLGFEYARSNKTEPRREGFVNAYAMTAAIEDKASVYEVMMARPDDLCELAKGDETLRIKSRIIWRRVLRAVGSDQFMRAAAPCVDWLD